MFDVYYSLCVSKELGESNEDQEKLKKRLIWEKINDRCQRHNWSLLVSSSFMNGFVATPVIKKVRICFPTEL